MNRAKVDAARLRGSAWPAVWRAACLSIFALALWAQPLLAAEEGQKPVEGPLGAFYKWLNFAIVFVLLAHLLVKKGPDFFRSRADAIAAAITESARLREQAEQQRREAEGKLASLPEEVAALRAGAQKDAAAEAARLRQSGSEEEAKIARMAQAEIQAAGRAARLELKRIAARLAVERAEAQLRAELTPGTEAALFRGFLTDLSGSVN